MGRVLMSGSPLLQVIIEKYYNRLTMDFDTNVSPWSRSWQGA